METFNACSNIRLVLDLNLNHIRGKSIGEKDLPVITSAATAVLRPFHKSDARCNGQGRLGRGHRSKGSAADQD